MREIKCPRVWDDVLEKVLYSTAEQFDDMLGFRFEQHLETENPVYMWPTGLKDKNGREIYEGDILVRVSSWTGKVYYYEVAWDAENARFISKGPHFQELLSSAIERGCTVVGNVYEHPHLQEGGAAV